MKLPSDRKVSHWLNWQLRANVNTTKKASRSAILSLWAATFTQAKVPCNVRLCYCFDERQADRGIPYCTQVEWIPASDFCDAVQFKDTSPHESFLKAEKRDEVVKNCTRNRILRALTCHVGRSHKSLRHRMRNCFNELGASFRAHQAQRKAVNCRSLTENFFSILSCQFSADGPWAAINLRLDR